MTVTVNGSARELAAGCTVAELLLAEGAPEKGIAVALNGTVVPRGRWTAEVPAGAVVEIVTAVQGG
ncbi:sulfur carrier protein ThiS [Rhodococcus sp. X156]|uniref:sulfur carrier protein ThiS n=1 Tax=Rhodococcus sp. X156 TaxID=2499145 RepID=UPI000FDC5494|nr:sulfur carrier protein ThiS [Rhodococcus sp. X156]